jgi:hypothetical protein
MQKVIQQFKLNSPGKRSLGRAGCIRKENINLHLTEECPKIQTGCQNSRISEEVLKAELCKYGEGASGCDTDKKYLTGLITSA